jgi:hypothetical protein
VNSHIGASALGLAGALPRRGTGAGRGIRKPAHRASLLQARKSRSYAWWPRSFARTKPAPLPFTEATGINVKYTYVPFANMREALTAEMVGGTGGFDIVVVMDQWVPSLVNLIDPMNERIAPPSGLIRRAIPRRSLILAQSAATTSLACQRARMCSSCSTAGTCLPSTTSQRPRPGTRWLQSPRPCRKGADLRYRAALWQEQRPEPHGLVQFPLGSRR